MEPKEQRKVDDFIARHVRGETGHRGFRLATQDLRSAGPHRRDDQLRHGGLEGIAETSIVLKEKGPRRVSPFFIPGRLINLASGYVSIAHGLKGPNHAVVTACSTGAHAIGDAARLVMFGDADVMVAGGAEVADLSHLDRRLLPPRARCRRGSMTRQTKASRPPTRMRDGFVMGEGAPHRGCSRSTSTPRPAARGSTPR